MQKSEEIKELATALCKAQAEFNPAEKDGRNPHFQRNYATLASVWDAARAPLAKNGLSIVQVVDGTDLLTILMHSSGQWIESRVPLILQRQDMQGLGAATTYARRIGMASIIGMTQEDDDGESAGRAEEKGKAAAPRPIHDPGKALVPNGVLRGKALNSLTNEQLSGLVDSVAEWQPKTQDGRNFKDDFNKFIITKDLNAASSAATMKDTKEGIHGATTGGITQ